MLSRDYKDVVAGLVLCAFGGWLVLYVSANYQMGTVQRMGPGMFPLGLGWLALAFGAITFIQALLRPGTLPEVRIWSPLFILIGIMAFAAMIRPFGLIPSIVALTAISSLADLKFRPITILVLSAVLSLMAWFVFIFALGLPMAMFRWSW